MAHLLLHVSAGLFKDAYLLVPRLANNHHQPSTVHMHEATKQLTGPSLQAQDRARDGNE